MRGLNWAVGMCFANVNIEGDSKVLIQAIKKEIPWRLTTILQDI